MGEISSGEDPERIGSFVGPTNGQSREGFRMQARRERSTRYRGRRRKASDERTRGKAVSAGRLWGFGAGAAVAVVPWPVEQVASSLFLQVIGIFDLQPSDVWVITIAEALGDHALKVVGAHEIKKLAPPALD
jgi:hypothetical protein